MTTFRSSFLFLAFMVACGSEAPNSTQSPVKGSSVGDDEKKEDETLTPNEVTPKEEPKKEDVVADAGTDAPVDAPPPPKTRCDANGGDGAFEGSCRGMSSAVSPYGCINYFGTFPGSWCQEAGGVFNANPCPTTDMVILCYYPKTDMRLCHEGFSYTGYGPSLKTMCEAGEGIATIPQ